MRWILKIILFPISLVLGVLTAFLKFLLGIGTALLYIVMLFCIFGALASFIQGEVGTGISGLIIGFLFSPYGLPMIGATVIAFIEVINDRINKSKNAIKRSLKSDDVRTETNNEAVPNTADYQTEVKENRIYDPLAKDTDGDGVADRYDSDFRDSEISYESLSNKKSKLHEKQKKAIKRRNYSDEIFTRKEAEDKTLKESEKRLIKDAAPKSDEIPKGTGSGKKAIEDRAKKNQLHKRHNKETLLGASAVSVAKASDVASRYLSAGSDENQGAEAGEKTLDTSSKLIHGVKNYSDKRRMKKSYDLSENSYRIAYTNTPDEKHEIQFELNLEEFTASQLVDGKEVSHYDYVKENGSEEKVLECMKFEMENAEFETFVSVSEEELKNALGLEMDDEGNLYDPLSKDLDNDGVPDRYDNDFRDSDYFETIYDVEDNLHAKEEKPSILGQIKSFQSEQREKEVKDTKSKEHDER